MFTKTMFKMFVCATVLGCSGAPCQIHDAGPGLVTPDAAKDAGPDPFGICVFGGLDLPCLGPNGEAQWIYETGINCNQNNGPTENLVCIGLVSPVKGKEGATAP